MYPPGTPGASVPASPFPGATGYGGYGIPAGPSPYAVTPAYGPTPTVTSGLAITALVLSLLWIGGFGSLCAVIFGAVALSQIRSSGGRKSGRGLARAGVIVGVLGLVVSVTVFAAGGVVVTHAPKSSSHLAPDSQTPRTGPVTAGVAQKLTTVSPKVLAAVGVPPQSVVVPPAVLHGQPKLTVKGKPGAVFVGAVFCPYCAAERWAIILAFSRFGTFSNLRQTTSSPWDVYPDTATFSFHGASYSSRYVALATAEHSGNDVNGPGTDTELEPLTTQEAFLWQKYDNSYGYPFLDIGNTAFVVSPSYSPGLLAGLDQIDIASKLSNPNAPSTQAIVGTANYLTAAICATTDQKPASVCDTAVVTKAAEAMNLSTGESLTSMRRTLHP
jgi:hypothetical protein